MPGRQTSLLSSSHHLKFYLDAQRLLLDSRHARGKGLPHAGGPSQGQLGNTFEASDGAGQNSGSAGSVHEQRADDFPTRDTPLQKTLQCNTSRDARLPRPVSGLLLGVLQEAHGIDGGGILLGIVQPAAGVVLYPVGAVTVAQQEVVGLFAL